MKFQWFHVPYALTRFRRMLQKSSRGSGPPDTGSAASDPMGWILARRSIRKFYSDPVPEDVIRQLLEAAMAAPSGNNARPWHFVVVQEREMLNRIADLHPYGKMCYEAPLAIVVCADPRLSEKYWVQDCSAATENILLAATALGLGSVWLAGHPSQERLAPVKELLNMPKEYTILSIVAIGRSAQNRSPRTQYDPERVHLDRW
ncbi:nitroreductase family protein [Candidatus Neomarinimicrobiota bacterium]